MDGFGTISAWGLLFILAGVVAWKFFFKSDRPASNPEDTLHDHGLIEDVQPEAPRAAAETSTGPLIFPGQSIIEHATETLEWVYDTLEADEVANERSHFYIVLTALTCEAYRASFEDDFGPETANYTVFIDAMADHAHRSYERRFGPWRPIDEDDLTEDFFEALAGEEVMVDGIWADRHRDLVGSDRDAANLIASRIDTLRD